MTRSSLDRLRLALGVLLLAAFAVHTGRRWQGVLHGMQSEQSEQLATFFPAAVARFEALRAHLPLERQRVGFAHEGMIDPGVQLSSAQIAVAMNDLRIAQYALAPLRVILSRDYRFVIASCATPAGLAVFDAQPDLVRRYHFDARTAVYENLQPARVR